MRDSNKLRDIKVLKARSDDLFHRPLVDNQYFLDILTGKKETFNYIDLNSTKTRENGEIPFIFFGEYLYYKLQKINITLIDILDQTNINEDTLYKLLEDDIFPWVVSPDSIKQLVHLLDISAEDAKKQIKIIPVDKRSVKNIIPSNLNYAARSNKDASQIERQKALVDAQILITIEKEEEKRNDLLSLL